LTEPEYEIPISESEIIRRALGNGSQVIRLLKSRYTSTPELEHILEHVLNDLKDDIKRQLKSERVKNCSHKSIYYGVSPGWFEESAKAKISVLSQCLDLTAKL
jgi:hypothetical protein